MLQRLLAPLLLLSVAGACRAGATDPIDPMDDAPPRTRVVLLGTGTPNADPERSGPALAVVVDDTAYLVDCGPGIVRRCEAARRRGVEALGVANLRHVFVTHLHSDHTVGLPDLIFTPWVLERAEPLTLVGPPGLGAMVEHVEAAWSQDVAVRLHGLEPANEHGYRTRVAEVLPGPAYADERVRVTAIPVDHGSWEHAYGYRFETPDRVVVVSGDTRPSEALVEAARGCDVLVHEVYSGARYRGRAPVWQRYHASFHTSTHELAELARRVRPELLVLTHQLYWGATDAELLEEIAELYDGAVVSGADLDVF